MQPDETQSGNAATCPYCGEPKDAHAFASKTTCVLASEVPDPPAATSKTPAEERDAAVFALNKTEIARQQAQEEVERLRAMNDRLADENLSLRNEIKCGAGRGSDTTGAAARNSRPTSFDLIGDPNFDPKGDDALSV